MDLDGTNYRSWTHTIRRRNRPLNLATHLTSSDESFVEEAVASCKVPASQRRLKISGGSIVSFPIRWERGMGIGSQLSASLVLPTDSFIAIVRVHFPALKKPSAVDADESPQLPAFSLGISASPGPDTPINLHRPAHIVSIQ